MSSLQRWVNENEIKDMTVQERTISLLYSLGIATREQIMTITGWSQTKVVEALKSIRQIEPTPEDIRLTRERIKQAQKYLDLKKSPEASAEELAEYEPFALDEGRLFNLIVGLESKQRKLEQRRDEWLYIMKAPTGESAYTLGRKGNTLARTLRDEVYSKEKRGFEDGIRKQVAHTLGINEVLCRLRRRGVMETDWLGSREVGQELYYHWHRVRPDDYIVYRPDAQLQLDDEKYYIEYDTGKENYSRLRSRFRNCLELYQSIKDPSRTRIPNEILWITTSEHRRKRIEEEAKMVLEDYIDDNPEMAAILRVPVCYAFVEGEDTRFLCGDITAKPFWTLRK
jgi:Replication-relaxation